MKKVSEISDPQMKKVSEISDPQMKSGLLYTILQTVHYLEFSLVEQWEHV